MVALLCITLMGLAEEVPHQAAEIGRFYDISMTGVSLG
jgi:hypothetical protein